MKKRLLISFSGGETSGEMTRRLLAEAAHEWDEIIITFSNTGEEDEKCLVFVDKCDRLLFQPMGYPVVWLEAVQNHGARKSADHKIVSFETASRNGEPFEDMIRKYGIPNNRFPHCTRDLKLAPIQSYARSLGWKDYKTAIGIRADEIDRMSEDADKRGIIYPLIKPWPMRKPQINARWAAMPFRLESTGYQGNCRTCWKKSDRKLFTIARENRRYFDNFARMERQYSHIGAEFERERREIDYILPEGYQRKFFRRGRSTAELLAESDALGDKFTPADDDAQVYELELDSGGGCGESCEVFTDYNMEDLEYGKDG